jgi:hypothetical protein
MRLQRLLLPAAATGLALSGAFAATAAHADPVPATPLISVVVPEQVTVIEGHTKTVHAQVANAGSVAAKGVYLTFGSTAHPVDPSVGLGLPAGCDAHGCLVGDLGPGDQRTYSFTLTPTADGTKVGSTFDLSIGAEGGVSGFDSEVTVVRAKSGVDLEVDPIDDMKLDRGQSADVPLLVRNTGSEDVDTFGVLLFAESGLEVLTQYRNCEVDEDIVNGVVCVFDQKFPAGATFTLPAATPLRIKVAADAGGPYKYSAVLAAFGLDDTIAITKSSGPTLKLQAAPAATDDDPNDINLDDNLAVFGVSVTKSAADSAAVGGTFAGAVGDTRTVKVGVRDLGPTGVIPSGLNWIQTVRVTVPTGLKLTRVDENCMPAGEADDLDFEHVGEVKGRDYLCYLSDRLATGAQQLYTFTGEITDGAHTGGQVVVDGGIQDTVKADDTAAIDVQVTASSGAGGGELPITGAPAGLVALGGALLLGGGITAFVVARRRRIVTAV